MPFERQNIYDELPISATTLILISRNISYLSCFVQFIRRNLCLLTWPQLSINLYFFNTRLCNENLEIYVGTHSQITIQSVWCKNLQYFCDIHEFIYCCLLSSMIDRLLKLLDHIDHIFTKNLCIKYFCFELMFSNKILHKIYFLIHFETKVAKIDIILSNIYLYFLKLCQIFERSHSPTRVRAPNHNK